MTTLKLTKPVVASLAPAAMRFVVWDASVPGFGVVVHPSGRKSFALFYRSHDGTQRKPTIGTFGPMTVDQARELARDMLAKVRAGEDPSQARRAARDAPTVDDAADRYMREHARLHKKKRSADTDEMNLRLHVRSRWGARKVASITHNDVVALHMAMKATPGAANRVIALLSKLFNLCEAWGLRPLNSNPCRHVRKYPERKLHAHLSAEQLGRLAAVLREAEEAHARVAARKLRENDLELAEHPSGIAIVRLLILTGMRLGEALALRWSEVDFKTRVLRLQDSKDQRASKPIEPKVLPLSGPTEELLKDQKKRSGASQWVFPGAKDPKKHFVGLAPIAKRLYARAGLSNFRNHDLRHNFGSSGAASFSLPMIGKLLGHKNPATTARYAQAAEDPQRAAADEIASKLAAAMAAKEP